MRTIIAGSRTITNYSEVEKAVNDCGWQVTEVICGGAAGVDTLGAKWANEHQVPLQYFLADWTTHGRAAGPIRNTEMALAADALVLVWDGKSRGSADMLNKATAKGLKTYIYVVDEDKQNEC